MDVSGPIRSRDVTNAVSAVSAVPLVRRRMVELQRELIDDGGIVVEGRDIGSVVAPEADLKIFLTADPAERAKRRNKQGLAGARLELDRLLQEMAHRDERDSTRAASPLSQAADAVVIDSTAYTLHEVIDQIAALAKDRG
jgi:CMP/dCMP kinase